MISKGINVVQVNPYAVKQSKEIEDNNQLKDDRKDPKLIANLVKDGNYGMPYLPKSLYADMRRRSMFRDQLTEDRIRNINRLHRELTPKDGLYIENALSKSQMVLKDDIATEDAIMDKYKNGFEITSFGAQAFTGGVNGSLRRGDIVDVYAVDPTTDMLVLMAENVYVYAVYDNTGNKVTSADETATAFTVYVTPEEVEQINMAVCYGGIQMYLKTE